MIEIKKATVCFMTTDIEAARRQLAMIDKSKLTFELDAYSPAERTSAPYGGFSPMINEAIDESECEFMIFMNPKSIPCAEDLNLIIEKLASGYCFASIFGVAFCGFSKQLVREIGMFDERFVAGEFEDNDFLLRMRLLGKAVWWGQDWNKYNYHTSVCPPARGSAQTSFWKKWRHRENSMRKLEWQEKRICKRHSEGHPEISQEWMEWNKGWGEGGIWDPMTSCEISHGWKESQEMAKIRISANFEAGFFTISMESDKETAISFFLTTEDRHPIYMHMVYQNDVHFAQVFDEKAELRIYHDGSIIYINRIRRGESLSMNFELPCSVAVRP